VCHTVDMVRRNRALTVDQQLEVVALYRAGAHAPQLAEQFGCSSATIYTTLDSHGVTRLRRGKFHGQEEEILDAYRAGEPMPELLHRFGITAPGFYKIRLRHNEPARPPLPPTSRFTEDQEAAIIAGYRDGLSLAELGRTHGCVLQTIRNVLERNGIPRRRRGNATREFSAEERAALAASWRAGMSQHAIGKELGLGQAQVSRLLRDLDAPPETRWARGERSASWKGGRVRVVNGYTAVRIDVTDPLRVMAQKHGYVLEHRLVMARSLGRPLAKQETVHHINGDRSDNGLENLQLRQGRHGKGVLRICADCGSHNIIETPLPEP
jgi:transposase